MGYESRVYVVESFEFIPCIETCGKKWCDKLATFNLCSCGYDFVEIFQDESEFYVCPDNSDAIILEDKYNKPLMQAPVQDVIDAIRNSEQLMDYNRTKSLLAYLESLEKDKDYYVLHYGY